MDAVSLHANVGIDDPNSRRGIYRQNGTAKPVVTSYTQTLPAVGIHPASGWNPEGYQQFSVSCNGRTCTFTSGYPQKDLQTFDWDFGDGSTATGRTVTHTYAAAGTYFVYHGALRVLEWPSDARMLIIP
jgi:hypothetical protein